MVYRVKMLTSHGYISLLEGNHKVMNRDWSEHGSKLQAQPGQFLSGHFSTQPSPFLDPILPMSTAYYDMLIWFILVVWNISYFSIYWESSSSNWRTHIFQKGRYIRIPPTSGCFVLSLCVHDFVWDLPKHPVDRGTATQCDRQWKDAVCLQECPADLPATEWTRSGRSKKHVSQQILEARDLTWNLTVAIV